MNELVNRWSNESMNEWTNKWMVEDEWVTSLLSYFFKARPRRWGTYSLSCFLSEQPLSYLGYLFSDSALSFHPASSSVASATQAFSSHSCCNAFSNLQLQSHLPGASQHHSCFAARSQANGFCHSRLQNRTAGASHTIDQHSHSADNGNPTTPTQIQRRSGPLGFCEFYMKIEPSLQSGAHFANLIFQKCADRGPAAETETLLWRLQEPHYRQKESESPRMFSPMNPRPSQLLDDGWLTWWCGSHDGGNVNHDNRPSEVF